MEQEQRPKHPYKVMIGDKIRVYRKDFNGTIYYNCVISQRNYDNTWAKYYRPLNFKKGVEVANETDIIIKDMYENLRPNKKDSYNPITALMITDFETVERQEQLEQQALANYRNNLDEIDDSQLPF